MPSITFVMTYYERPEQLRNTLTALRPNFQSDDQLVIVDDGSCPEKGARTALSGMDLPVELAEIRPERKWWINPSVPYNIGFQMAKREAVVIMNSECIPVKGAIKHLRSHVRKNNYVVMPCYSTTESEFRSLCQIRSSGSNDFTRAVLPFKQNQWYHHPKHSPVWYHFMSCLTLENLRALGGFNEEFARGFCFEDNEFLWRIRKSLKVEGEDESSGLAIHQWHPKNKQLHGGCEEWKRNLNLWNQIREGRK